MYVYIRKYVCGVTQTDDIASKRKSRVMGRDSILLNYWCLFCILKSSMLHCETRVWSTNFLAMWLKTLKIIIHDGWSPADS